MAYLVKVGIPIGDSASVVQGIAMGTTMYASFDVRAIASLSVWTLIITLLASLYPARYASHLEPVEALRAQ